MASLTGLHSIVIKPDMQFYLEKVNYNAYQKYLGKFMQWASLAFENLSLLTHSLQRILEHSVHSKQYKQTTINNNPTNNKTNTTSNMDHDKQQGWWSKFIT